jgi:FkbM family methyltransferase
METWIDVGAHLGEKTLEAARANPELRVFAFEPNLAVARKLFASPWNYIVMPLAVSEANGVVDFTFNADDACSSLLPLNPEGVEAWVEREEAGGIFRGGEWGLKETGHVQVPSIRLNTFMDIYGIQEVSWLKIDAQGHDLEVVKSAGIRLHWIERITLEVQITEIPLYQGASTKDEVLEYMEEMGFVLVSSETQSLGMEENLTFVNKRA